MGAFQILMWPRTDWLCISWKFVVITFGSPYTWKERVWAGWHLKRWYYWNVQLKYLHVNLKVRLDSCVTMKDHMKETEIQPVLPAKVILSLCLVYVCFCLTLIPEHGDDDCCSWQPSGSTKLQCHSHPTGQRLGTGKSAIFLSFLTVNSWVVQPSTVPFTACNKTVETVLHNKIHIRFPPLSIPSIPNLKCIIQPWIILVQQ